MTDTLCELMGDTLYLEGVSPSSLFVGGSGAGGGFTENRGGTTSP